MINIDVIEYAFVDESIAQSLCDILKIESVQLMKKRLIVDSLSGSRLKSVRFLVGESGALVASGALAKIIKINH
jgi:hypothetical protein